MPLFRFRMQRLLEHRQRIEQNKQRRVATLEQERTAIETKIREQQHHIEHAKQDLRDVLHPVGTPSAPSTNMVDVRAARLQAGASIHCLQLSQQLVLTLAGVHNQLQDARRVLLDATTARKAVDLLRDKAFASWKHAQDKRETDELDDFGATRWIRQRQHETETQR